MKNSSLPELVKKLNRARLAHDKGTARAIEAELDSRLNADRDLALQAFAKAPALPPKHRKDYSQAV